MQRKPKRSSRHDDTQLGLSSSLEYVSSGEVYMYIYQP